MIAAQQQHVHASVGPQHQAFDGPRKRELQQFRDFLDSVTPEDFVHASPGVEEDEELLEEEELGGLADHRAAACRAGLT